MQDRRLPSPLLHMPPGSGVHQRNKRCQRHKASEADRGKWQKERDRKRERERTRAGGKIEKEMEES